MSNPFGEPPKGLNLAENSTGRNDAVVVCMYTLAFVTIGFRLFSRIKIQQANIGLDDWLIVGALLSGTANMACAIAGGHYGLGKHVWVVTLDEIIHMVHWTMWACIALSIGYWIGCSVAFLCSCQPISYYWTQYENPLGGYVRYDLYPFYIAHAVVNMAGDLLILLVPIPLVWRLKLRVGQKIQILSIFLLGGFVCVASAIRIYYFTFINDVDVTWNLGNVFIWSSVEPSIGIVCACLPVLQPLFRTIINRRSLPNRTTTKGVRFAPDIMSKIHGEDRRQTREDEAVLTTTSVHIEMDGVGKGRLSDEEEAMGYDLMSIKVQKDFQMEEEHRR
ncbi:uncharacterized protein An06g01290 [Aspergillus niger]|uniref:Contig An06c0070, genomic contig n=2 Tax=Aspergillus niger TaxID=5061 RepID=A2QLH8_ASPNC|nr:uncharacterized protein An06g01290 [Aspergillus niger]CAK39197.1 unnamed protein product [Aspergillus niger]